MNWPNTRMAGRHPPRQGERPKPPVTPAAPPSHPAGLAPPSAAPLQKGEAAAVASGPAPHSAAVASGPAPHSAPAGGAPGSQVVMMPFRPRRAAPIIPPPAADEMELASAARLVLGQVVGWGVALLIYAAVLLIPWLALGVVPPPLALALGSLMALIWGVGLARRRPPPLLAWLLLGGLGVDLLTFVLRHLLP